MPASTTELLDRVFRDPGVKQGLRYFTKGERDRIKLRESADEKVEIWCAKRALDFAQRMEKEAGAKPEAQVRLSLCSPSATPI